MYGRARVRARLRTRALACLQLLLSRDSRRHVQRRLAARRVNGRLTVPDRTWLLRSAVRQRALIAVPNQAPHGGPTCAHPVAAARGPGPGTQRAARSAPGKAASDWRQCPGREVGGAWQYGSWSKGRKSSAQGTSLLISHVAGSVGGWSDSRTLPSGPDFLRYLPQGDR